VWEGGLGVGFRRAGGGWWARRDLGGGGVSGGVLFPSFVCSYSTSSPRGNSVPREAQPRSLSINFQLGEGEKGGRRGGEKKEKCNESDML